MYKEIDTTNAVKNNFRKGYDMLPSKFKTNVRIKIMNGCDWLTQQTFYNKLNGKKIIRSPEKIVIEKIFAEYNLDAWTGEYLK